MAMKVALLTLEFHPQIGGVQSDLKEIATRLTSRCDVLVVTPVPASSNDAPFRREVVSPAIPAFIRTLHRVKPDCVLVGHAHPRLLIPAAIAAWRRYGVIAHGNDFLAAQRRWHRPLFNWLLRNARPLITHSKSNARRLLEIGCPRPVVIPPGTDPERFTPPPSPPPPPWVLLTVSRLVPRKGIDTVLQALPSLIKEFPDLNYNIVGEGPDRERLQRIVHRLGLEAHVRFLGRVPEEELPEVYRRAHIFVLPVREEPSAASVEGFGIVYLEASASGLPVIAGRSGGAQEAVKDGVTGFLVPPDDSIALANALRKLIADPELRIRLGKAGRHWVEKEMHWDRVAKEVFDALSG